MQIFTEGKRAIKVGTSFGRWRALGPVFLLQRRTKKHNHVQRYLVVVCECSDCSFVSVCEMTLLNRLKQAGGGHRCKKYSNAGENAYRVWQCMVQRCYNPSHKSYKNYGGRGIEVCREWRTSSRKFLNWANDNGWDKGLDIDRVDNDGNYEPSNCRFVTRQINLNNKRSNHRISAFGKTKTIADWARDEQCRVSAPTLSQRINNGVAPDVAISTPVYFMQSGRKRQISEGLK